MILLLTADIVAKKTNSTPIIVVLVFLWLALQYGYVKRIVRDLLSDTRVLSKGIGQGDVVSCAQRPSR